jgi:protein TonB
METNKILSADALDLLFEGRNKEYGAYDLRKTYNGRLGRALGATAGVVVVLFCFGFVSGRGKVRSAPMVEDITIAAPPLTPLPPTPPPPVVPRTQPPVATKIFTAPQLVDHDVPDDEKPPVTDDLDKVKIGTVNTPGGVDAGVDAGPTAVGDGHTGVVTQPKEGDDDGIFKTVEIDASYPGGMPAWARFLHKNLNYPEDAIEKGVQGPVMIQFIVDKEGNVSDIEVVSGPTDGGLREEAIRVIRKSGKWTPAIQNGRVVKSYKRQPVIFQMPEGQ